MNNGITINGANIEDFGASILAGSFTELMAPAPLKEYIENDDPMLDGIQIADYLPSVNAREVTLTFLINGSDTNDFMAKHLAFVSLLHKGVFVLHVPALDSTFRLLYLNATRFDNYQLKSCKMAVKFLEPDPTNRGL